MTHLGDVPFRAAKVHKKHVHEITAINDGHCFLLQGVLRAHRDYLAEFWVLKNINGGRYFWFGSVDCC